MYTSDTEVHSFFTKALSWLRPGGFLFFRETCFKAHGTIFFVLIVYVSKHELHMTILSLVTNL